jgi:hypothetical protein
VGWFAGCTCRTAARGRLCWTVQLLYNCHGRYRLCWTVQLLYNCHGRYRLLSRNLKIKVYKTIIFPVVLYGCETWSLTLRDERRLRVFENTVLRRVFGPKRDEGTGE